MCCVFFSVFFSCSLWPTYLCVIGRLEFSASVPFCFVELLRASWVDDCPLCISVCVCVEHYVVSFFFRLHITVYRYPRTRSPSAVVAPSLMLSQPSTFSCSPQRGLLYCRLIPLRLFFPSWERLALRPKELLRRRGKKRSKRGTVSVSNLCELVGWICMAVLGYS